MVRHLLPISKLGSSGGIHHPYGGAAASIRVRVEGRLQFQLTTFTASHQVKCSAKT